MATVAVKHFSDRLAVAVERKQSQLVVGLDPVLEQLPGELDGDLLAFCTGIVDAVAPYAVAVKPQSAFFEAHGAEGVRAFAEVCDYARAADLLVIADVKRGDIGSTARYLTGGTVVLPLTSRPSGRWTMAVAPITGTPAPRTTRRPRNAPARGLMLWKYCESSHWLPTT